jgi:uncharacterized protein (TIGR00730 family)
MREIIILDSEKKIDLTNSFEKEASINQKILELIDLAGIESQSITADLIRQMIEGSLKMAGKEYDKAQLKLKTRAFKEMRYAYRVFNENRQQGRCVSIFGSSRTPKDHPDYLMAKSFGAEMSERGWLCMTGAADGIMRAGLEDVPKSSSYGLSIKLPYENSHDMLLSGDPKLINFRYFFTRKLMFLSQSDALAAFPGGVGTQDELFEALTLMQTGKANIVPLVLLEGIKGNYWSAWEDYIQNNLLANGWVSPEDQHFYYIAPTLSDAVEHIQHFYKRYHSSRYVGEILVIRLLTPLSSEQINLLNQEFKMLIKDGTIYATGALAEESDHLDLPRIAFEHHRKGYGYLRLLIDRLNDF